MISSGTIIVAGMKFRLLLNLIRPFIRRNSTEFVLYPIAVLKILFSVACVRGFFPPVVNSILNKFLSTNSILVFILV